MLHHWYQLHSILIAVTGNVYFRVTWYSVTRGPWVSYRWPVKKCLHHEYWNGASDINSNLKFWLFKIPLVAKWWNECTLERDGSIKSPMFGLHPLPGTAHPMARLFGRENSFQDSRILYCWSSRLSSREIHYAPSFLWNRLNYFSTLSAKKTEQKVLLTNFLLYANFTWYTHHYGNHYYIIY
jgi:hypothetical protein